MCEYPRVVEGGSVLVVAAACPGEGPGGPFSFPELSPDGLNLFGTAEIDGERLVVASRAQASGPFSSPTSAGLPAPTPSYLQFGPTVSQSCRLFYLNFVASPSLQLAH